MDTDTVPQPLRDILTSNLKAVFIGFNPGLRSAELRHHYAGKSNRFWKFLYESGLTPVQIKAEDDWTLIQYGYGSTNICDRPSKSADELTKEEFHEGRKILRAKLELYRPWVACYMGIGVYREFTGLKQIKQGLQSSGAVLGIRDFVISSPSGLNRIPIADQLAYYCQLKRLLDELALAPPDSCVRAENTEQ